jgi:hypothetical protein
MGERVQRVTLPTKNPRDLRYRLLAHTKESTGALVRT